MSRESSPGQSINELTGYWLYVNLSETLQAIITTIVLSYLQQSLKEMLLLHYERLAFLALKRDTKTQYEHLDCALWDEIINNRPFASDPPSSN